MTRPRIGLTTDTVFLTRQGASRPVQAVAEDYLAVVRAAGGIPVPIPSSAGSDEAMAIARGLDGLLLTGGGDVDPRHFGEDPHPDLRVIDPARDETEIALCRFARDTSRPLLGICRGIQVLAVALGGTVIQHLDRAEVPGLIDHEIVSVSPGAGHRIEVEAGTRLREILGADAVFVTSSHHQAVGEPGEGMVVSARTRDGVIEAIEHPGHPFLLGVEWHPEREPDGSPAGVPVLAALVSACGGGV
jgi:putative glutamine amidotransferase